MDDDKRYYSRVAEPAVVDGEARLLKRQAARCEILDRAALDRIAGQVGR